MHGVGYDGGEILGGTALRAGLRHHKEELVEDTKERLDMDQRPPLPVLVEAQEWSTRS